MRKVVVALVVMMFVLVAPGRARAQAVDSSQSGTCATVARCEWRLSARQRPTAGGRHGRHALPLRGSDGGAAVVAGDPDGDGGPRRPIHAPVGRDAPGRRAAGPVCVGRGPVARDAVCGRRRSGTAADPDHQRALRVARRRCRYARWSTSLSVSARARRGDRTRRHDDDREGRPVDGHGHGAVGQCAVERER